MDSGNRVDGDDNGGSHVESRRIFINTPLPNDMIAEDTGLPLIHYPRNKIRTTKYTPLSFVPKNLFYQFHNVANIYFLLVVILGVCPSLLLLFLF